MGFPKGFLWGGAVFSIRYGRQDEDGLKEGILASFVLIAGITILLNILAFLSLNHIRVLLQVPNEVWGLMREYLIVIFSGITATFLYNYFAIIENTNRICKNPSDGNSPPNSRDADRRNRGEEIGKQNTSTQRNYGKNYRHCRNCNGPV